MADGQQPDIEALLTALYGEGESDEKVEHRARVLPDGTLNSFQLAALKGRVDREASERASAGPDELVHGAAPLPQVAPELQGDIPEPIEGYEDRIDVVAAIKSTHGIVAAVQRWGKPQPSLKIGSKTDGIHVRCPFPAHVDNDPSAWINTSKDTWFCGGCQVGGDQIDFYAAAKWGLNPSTWHGDKELFRQILIELAENLGIDTEPPSEPPPLMPIEPPEPEPDDDPDAAMPWIEPEIPPAEDNVAPTAPAPSIEALDPDADWDPLDKMYDPLDDPRLPEYDWRDLNLPEGTFLHDWMVGNTADLPDVLPEFFIMLGFQALGLACGHHMQTVTGAGILNTSLMLCLVGPSGAGKSKALKRLTDLFDEHAGSEWDPNLGTGIKVFTTPGSPEAMLKTLYHDVEDPMDPLKRIEVPVTALLKEDEFATFVAKAGRKGGEHLKQRVMGFHDFVKTRDRPEIVFHDSSLMNGERSVHDTFFSATFLTQNGVIRKQIEENDMFSGFMNRIIPVFGRRRYKEDPRWVWNTGTPSYVPAWQNTWDRLRRQPVMTRIPIEPAAKEFLWKDRIWNAFNDYGDRDDLSILSRLKHNTHRIAFLLAVNDLSPSVQTKHYERALHFMDDYVRRCYATFVNAARSTESKDLRQRILEWVAEYYQQTGEWPERRHLSQKSFWRGAPDSRQQTLDQLIRDQELVQVRLRTHAKSVVQILIATEGHWANYSTMNDKIYEKDVFYANAKRA